MNIVKNGHNTQGQHHDLNRGNSGITLAVVTDIKAG
jgi:hypothetical protein